MLAREKFSFLYVDFSFDVTKSKFIVKNNSFKMLVVFSLIFVADTKINFAFKYFRIYRWGAGACALFFCNNLFFVITLKNYKLCYEVKLIINNAPLTYVYPNTIKTCLTLNHLLFGRQLLYYSNTTSTVVRNLTVLSSTTDKINRIRNHFWHRWRNEYVLNLHETQRTSKLNIKSQKFMFC